MRQLQYKIIISLALVFCVTSYAQKFDKKYTEEFNTNSEIVIDVDTRHTDIQIETWNKNIVSIEATIEIEGASKEKAEEIIKNWKFKALGNKNEIDIVSKTSGLFNNNIIISDGDILSIRNHDSHFVFPEVSIGNLGILDSFDIVMPDIEAFPEVLVISDIPSFDFDFDMPSFDYEKYKNDKNYMKNWQKKMKKGLEKMQIKMKENPVRIKKNSAKLKEELKAAQEERKKILKEHVHQRKEAMKLRQKYMKERTEQRKEAIKNNQHVLAKKRVEIKNILADRNKIKIKRIIKIRAPKNAKFNMNVRYGSMSFPN